MFKLFLSDDGLLTSCYSISVKKELLEMNPERELNNDSLFENFVAQEIYARTQSSYYYKKNGVGEVDFMVSRKIYCCPFLLQFFSWKRFKEERRITKMEQRALDKEKQ